MPSKNVLINVWVCLELQNCLFKLDKMYSINSIKNILHENLVKNHKNFRRLNISLLNFKITIIYFVGFQ